jgi:hypothetical protein
MSGPSITFEIEVSLSGSIDPGELPSGPTYSCGGTPGCDPFVEDMDVIDIGLVESEIVNGKVHWKTISLLDGIDRKNPEIQKLFSNILAMMAEDAEMAILEDAAE